MKENNNQVNINSEKEVLKQYGEIAKVINELMEKNTKQENNKESQQVKK